MRSKITIVAALLVIAATACSRTQIVFPDCPQPRNARPVHREPPEYPQWARMMSLEGHVDLVFRVEASGEVEDVSVVDAHPRGVFEDEARAAIEKWRFEPATCAGKPVPSRFKQRLTFKLPPKSD